MTAETTVNLASLPYNYTADRPDYHLMPMPEMHTLMCDLTKKIPSIRFVSTGRAYLHGNTYADEFNVFTDTEKVGRLWQTGTYVDGAYVKQFGISSPRISQGRNGRYNNKKTRHYKIALREAVKAFMPPDIKDVMDKIISTTDDLVGRLMGRATSQLEWSLKQGQVQLAEYAANVQDNGPQPLPDNINRLLHTDWRVKLLTHRIANEVTTAMKRMEGIALKLAPDNTFIAVDIKTKELVAMSQNPYDLPDEYQTKFAVLKMMDKDQFIATTGVKAEYDGAMYFYMTPGDMAATAS